MRHVHGWCRWVRRVALILKRITFATTPRLLRKEIEQLGGPVGYMNWVRREDEA
jgi:hypothetical protein